MDFFRQLYEQFVTLWKSLSLRQRFVIGGGFASAIILLFLITLWQATPEYDILFANLQERDAAETVEELKGLDVPYKLAGDGTTILIPPDRVAETRLALAQKGLPRGGGVGYEIFDRTRLGVTSFEQKVNLKRATEGELARTINQLEEVEWSRVQIVTPEERLFTEQQRDPTASVFLNMAYGQTLQRKQVRAIQHLVAYSVENLKPEKITIVDQYANPLSGPTEIEIAATELSASQFELRSRVERYFQQKIQSMFDRIVGPGKSIVSVSVDLDFDSIERTEEKYDPDGAVVRSEQRQKESTKAPSSKPEGISGVSANLPTVTPIAAASISGPEREASSSITNFEVSKTVEHIIKSPSSIKGISVSAVVDGGHKIVTAEDGTTAREYIPRSEEEMDKYRRMVLAAVGTPMAKDVEVINVPLKTTAAEWEREIAAQIQEKREMQYALIKVIATMGVLAFIFFLIRYVLKRALPGVQMPGEGQVGPRMEPVSEEPRDTTDEAKDLAKDRPDDVASLIKVWLHEED